MGRLIVDALVLDDRGEPIPDLAPSDFRATVAGRAAPVEAADWIPAAAPEGPPVTADGTRHAGGRLLVFLVQAPRDGGQMAGLLRTWHSAAPLLDGLLPTDRGAVLAWRGRLRVLQDFTADGARLRGALRAALVGGRTAAGAPDAPFPALALDAAALAKTTSMERALETLADALAPIGGAKGVVFLGWGVAVNHAPSEGDTAARADAALRAARATLFTLDPSSADFHTLEMGLQTLSARSGGFYAKTNVFPRLATRRVAQALSGRYVLTLVAPEGAKGPVAVELTGRRGSVSVRE